MEGIHPESIGNENYLIWGPPGSGKTYLIEQIAESLNDVDYRVLNLTKLEHHEFQLELDKIEERGIHCICLIDEVYSESSANWAYESLLPHLQPSSPRKFRVCFVLAGSGEKEMGEMEKKIILQNKGKDLLSRIPPKNKYIVPTLDVGDDLLVGTSQLLNIATENNREINTIGKLALFYIAVNPQLNSARQIKELVVSAMKRIPKGEDRIQYDHLFEFGDSVNKEFYQKVKFMSPELLDSFIHIEKD